MSSVSYRPGVSGDAVACGTIIFEAFAAIADKHNFPHDIPSKEIGIGLATYLLSHPHMYGVVAEKDGRIIGSNFIMGGGPIFGIGPITVDPASQDSSVGRGLMEGVLAIAREKGAVGVRLVQTAYHRRSVALYTKLGFDVREPLACLQGAPLKLTIPGHMVRPATLADVDACCALAHALQGFDRRHELVEEIGKKHATVVEFAGRIVGYANVVGFFGHAIAENNEAMKALIGAAPAFAGPGFLLPMRNSELFRWCLANGLRIVHMDTLMTTGLYTEPKGAWLPSITF